MKYKMLLPLAILFGYHPYTSSAQSTKYNDPIVDGHVIFEEKNGLVAVEAEYFYKQIKQEIRAWYRTSKTELPRLGRDDDEQHCFGASNNAYLEILPDERVTHSDKLMPGVNFTDQPGIIGVINYKVKINTPGRYYVWARAMSTGGEDNGVHVGINGTWPEHGQRMQWCDGKNNWTWGNSQRTKEVHCGVPHEIYLDVDKAGVHDIQFSMREDGFELDKFILTSDIHYLPTEKGPEVIAAQGSLPKGFEEVPAPIPPKSYFTTISKSGLASYVISSQEFTVDDSNFYKNGKNWLAINPELHKEAQTSTIFKFESGKYDIVFVGVGENDGSSTFSVLINDKVLGTFSPPLTDKQWEEGKQYNKLWSNIIIKKGDKVTVIAKIGSSNGKEFTRGRWAGFIFTLVGKGKLVQEAPSSDAFIR